MFSVKILLGMQCYPSWDRNAFIPKDELSTFFLHISYLTLLRSEVDVF